MNSKGLGPFPLPLGEGGALSSIASGDHSGPGGTSGIFGLHCGGGELLTLSPTAPPSLRLSPATYGSESSTYQGQELHSGRAGIYPERPSLA